jgi:hypothetical protein
LKWYKEKAMKTKTAPKTAPNKTTSKKEKPAAKTHADNIVEKSSVGDPFEFDSEEDAQDVFKLLPEGDYELRAARIERIR